MLPLFILFTSAESSGVDLADGRTLALSQALIAEPQKRTSGSEPWRVLRTAFCFLLCMSEWAPAIAGSRTQLEPIFCLGCMSGWAPAIAGGRTQL